MSSKSPRLSISVGSSVRNTGEVDKISEDMYVGYAERIRSTYIRAHLRGDALGYRFKTFMFKATQIQEQQREDRGEEVVAEKCSRRVMVSRLRKLQRGWIWRVWYSFADGVTAIYRFVLHPSR